MAGSCLLMAPRAVENAFGRDWHRLVSVCALAQLRPLPPLHLVNIRAKALVKRSVAQIKDWRWVYFLPESDP